MCIRDSIPQQLSTASTISPIELKFSGKFRPSKWSRLVTKNFTLPKPKLVFWAKRGVKRQKISQKLNQVWLSSNFQGSLGPANGQGDKIFYLTSAKIIFMVKRDGDKPPKNHQKTQSIWIWLKFSEQAETNKWSNLVTKIFTPPKPKSYFWQKKGG